MSVQQDDRVGDLPTSLGLYSPALGVVRPAAPDAVNRLIVARSTDATGVTALDLMAAAGGARS